MPVRRALRVALSTVVAALLLILTSPSAPAAVTAVQTRTATTGKTVALTFDDGPGPSTAQILAILARYGVRATFFNVGTAMAAHPELVRAMAQQGHTLGDHTWDHAHMSQLTEAQQADEIDRQAAEQRALVGTTPTVMRPPYGEYDDTTLAVAAARGLSVWNWSCSTQDWKANGASTSYWVNRIVTRAEAAVKGPHPVILMHDAPAPGDPATVLALPRIIQFFRDHGYTFVDVLGHHGLAAYAPSGAPAPAVAATSGGLHVFVRDASGRVLERTAHAGTWSATRRLGASTRFGPAAATVGSSTTLVAVTDAAGHVQVRDVTDSGGGRWSAVGGHAVGRPAVAADTSRTSVYLAVRTPSGAVALRERVHGRWLGWHGLGGHFVTAPAVAVAADGRPTVAAATAAGDVLLRHRTRTGWSAWHRVATGSTADPALATAADSRHLVLAVRDAGGSIVVRTAGADATSWTAPRTLAGVARSGAAVAASAGRLGIYVIDGRGRVLQSRGLDPWHSLPQIG